METEVKIIDETYEKYSEKITTCLGRENSSLNDWV